MAKQKRLFAEAVTEIASPETGEVTGWLYQWNDGSKAPILATGFPAGLVDADHATAGDVLAQHDDGLGSQAVA